MAACYIWNDGVSLQEIDQNFLFGWIIVYRNSYLDSILCYSKVFWLHAILHDAAGAVRSHTGKVPGYCYMIWQSPNSRLLGHVTGLFFCLNVNIFPPSTFKSLDFWSSMSCIVVLDLELADRIGFAPLTHLDTRPHFTVPSRRQRFLMYGLCSIKSWKVCNVKHIVHVYEKKIFWIDSLFFFEIPYWEVEGTTQMTDREDNINLGKIAFDDNNQEKKSWSCLGQTCSRSLNVFLSLFFVFSLITFGCFWRNHRSKT